MQNKKNNETSLLGQVLGVLSLLLFGSVVIGASLGLGVGVFLTVIKLFY